MVPDNEAGSPWMHIELEVFQHEITVRVDGVSLGTKQLVAQLSAPVWDEPGELCIGRRNNGKHSFKGEIKCLNFRESEEEEPMNADEPLLRVLTWDHLEMLEVADNMQGTVKPGSVAGAMLFDGHKSSYLTVPANKQPNTKDWFSLSMDVLPDKACKGYILSKSNSDNNTINYAVGLVKSAAGCSIQFYYRPVYLKKGHHMISFEMGGHSANKMDKDGLVTVPKGSVRIGNKNPRASLEEVGAGIELQSLGASTKSVIDRGAPAKSSFEEEEEEDLSFSVSSGQDNFEEDAMSFGAGFINALPPVVKTKATASGAANVQGVKAAAITPEIVKPTVKAAALQSLGASTKSVIDRGAPAKSSFEEEEEEDLSFTVPSGQDNFEEDAKSYGAATVKATAIIPEIVKPTVKAAALQSLGASTKSVIDRGAPAKSSFEEEEEEDLSFSVPSVPSGLDNFKKDAMSFGAATVKATAIIPTLVKQTSTGYIAIDENDENEDDDIILSDDVDDAHIVFATVTFDFDNEEAGEIELRVDDRVSISNKEGNETGWWYGTNLTTNLSGVFPSSYVEEDQ